VLGAIVVFTIAAGVARYAHGVNDVIAFALATVALAGLAWVVSFATEQVGGRFGPSITGFMQSTLGNLPEFFVVIFALNAGETVVAETAILGSILVNALLVLGLVIVAGALHDRTGVMRFNPHLPNDTATLLLMSSFIIVLTGLANLAHDPASHHTKTISIIGAIAILLVYGAWARQYLSSAEIPGQEAENRGQEAENPGEEDKIPGEATEEEPRLSPRTAVILLALGGAGSAFVSDWFVHALQPTIHTLHISRSFAGLVIVAIAGNAVEHAVGIVLAAKGHAELAIAVVKNSVGQIAAFLYPLLVLVSLLTKTSLTFSLPAVYIGALFATAVIVWQITGDGEATAFEGTALVAAFIILATVAAFES
jgi:Ca2+:H+ antiporter